MFLILVPTIRPAGVTNAALARAYETASYPTDLFVLHGAQGKSATMNYARRLMDCDRYRYVVTMDDDILLPFEWQRDCIAALEVGDLAACGLDLSDTEEGRKYMHEVNDWELCGNSHRIRPLRNCNIGGIFICMRTITALEIGPYPWDGKTHYEVDEDGWRCARIRRTGGKLGYVETRCGKPEMVTYADSAEYLATKAADLNYVRNIRGFAKC